MTIDDERVTLPPGTSSQGAEVAAGGWLREALAETQLAARDRRQEAVDECGRGKALERGTIVL